MRDHSKVVVVVASLLIGLFTLLAALPASAQLRTARDRYESERGKERAGVVWQEVLEETQEHLQGSRYPEALTLTSRMMARLAPTIVKDGDQGENLLGTVHALHAIALAGTGDEGGARWHWTFGQSLAPSLVHTSLASYGEAAEVLEPYRLVPGSECRWVEEVEDGSAEPETLTPEKEIEAPVKIESPPPSYSVAARKAGVEGQVIVRTVVKTDGSIDRLWVVMTESPALAHQLSKVMKSWRFEPATRDGEPVEVYYNLTTNFTLGRS